MIRATCLGLCDDEPACTYVGDHADLENRAQIDAGEKLWHQMFRPPQKIETDRHEKPKRPRCKDLVFGLLRKNDGAYLIFIEEPEARRLAAIHTAIASSKTWRSFCRKMPPEDLAYVLEELRATDRYMPRTRDSFDSNLLPGE